MYRRRGSADCTEEAANSFKSKVNKVSNQNQHEIQSHSQINGNCKNHNNNKKGTFRKSSSVEPSSVSVCSASSSKSHHLRKKSFTSFWSNLFSTKIPENRNSGISTQSSSFESVNTILSTNSFSFVSPKRYKGKNKGKRIPVAADDGPMKPRRKISTLTRIGMKMGLKSKYNLQSCESLHHLSYMDAASACSSNTGTLNLNTLMRKKRKAPAPPPTSTLTKSQEPEEQQLHQQPQPSTSAAATSVTTIVTEPQPCCSKSCVSVSPKIASKSKTPAPPDLDHKDNAHEKLPPPKGYKIETFKITAHKRSSSEGHSHQTYVKPSAQFNSSTLTNTYRSKSHVRGKRKAPVPPNPFGDPDAPEETEEENRDRDRLTDTTSYTTPNTSSASNETATATHAPISSSGTSVSVPKSTDAATPVVNPGSSTSGSGSTTSGSTSQGKDTPSALAGLGNCRSKSSDSGGAQSSSMGNPKPGSESGAASAGATTTTTANATQMNHVNAEVNVIRSANASASDDIEPTNQIQTPAAMASALTPFNPEQDEEIAQNILNDKQEQRSAQQEQQRLNQNQNRSQLETSLEAENRPGPSRKVTRRNEFPTSPLPPTPTEEDRQIAQKELDVLIAVSSQPRTLDDIDEQTQLQLSQLKREADKSPLMFLRPKSKHLNGSPSSLSSTPNATSKNQSQFSFNFNFHGANSSGSSSSSPHNSHSSHHSGGGRLSSTFITPPASPHSPFEEPLSPSSSTSSNSTQYPPASSPTSTTSSGKITPRPWYKRSSSSSSSKKSKQLIKPLATMTKFSDIDREASRIVEENRRRSAEKAYNETARELITMFNAFNKTQITGNADGTNLTDDAENNANESSEHAHTTPPNPSQVQPKPPVQQVDIGSSSAVDSSYPGNSSVPLASTSSSRTQVVNSSFPSTSSTSSPTAVVAGTSGGSSKDKRGISSTLSVSTGNSKVTVTHSYNNNAIPDSTVTTVTTGASASVSCNGVAATNSGSSSTEETSKKLAIVQPQSSSRQPSSVTSTETGTGATPVKMMNGKPETTTTTIHTASTPAGATASGHSQVGKISSIFPPAGATPAATSVPSSIFSRLKQDWTCARCTLKNPHWRSACEACYYKSDSSVQKLSSAFENNSVPTSSSTVASTFIPANGKLNPNPVSTAKAPLTSVSGSGSTLNTTSSSNTSNSSSSSALTNKVLPTQKVEGSCNASASSVTTTAATKGQDNLNVKNPPAIPSCENFLSQLPVKETLAREEKLVGMKLDEESTEELDIIRLRQARLAFFNKTTAPGANKTDDNTNTTDTRFASSTTSASDRNPPFSQPRAKTTDDNVSAAASASVNEYPSTYSSNSNSKSTSQNQPKPNNLAVDSIQNSKGTDRNRKQPTEKKKLNVFSDDEDDSIDALLQIPNFKSPSHNNVNNSFNNNTTTIAIKPKDNGGSNTSNTTVANITCNNNTNAPNFNGPRNWNPLHMHRFRPMLESILESTNDVYLRVDHPHPIPIYENWDLSLMQSEQNANSSQNQCIIPYTDNNNFVLTSNEYPSHHQYPPSAYQYQPYRHDHPCEPDHPINLNGRKTWTNTFMQLHEFPHNSPTDNNNYCSYANSHSDSSSCSEYEAGNLTVSQTQNPNQGHNQGVSSSSSAATEPIDMDGRNRAPSRRHSSSHHHHSHYYYNRQGGCGGVGATNGGVDGPNGGVDERKLTLDDYRKLGAIPKNFEAYYGNRNTGEDNNNLSGGSSGSSGSGSGSRDRDDRDRNHRRHSGYCQSSTGRDEFKTFDDGDRSNVSDYTNFGDSTNTLAVNKLLRKLECAIAKGDHRLAATLAHDLALLKVNCVVAKGGQNPQLQPQPITIRVYVEDRFMQQGPFQVQVTSQMNVKELKNKIETDWSIPAAFQKWILGRKIAEEDTQLLSDFDVVHDSMAFLYLVTPQIERPNEMTRSEPTVPVNGNGNSNGNTSNASNSSSANPKSSKVKQKQPSSPQQSRSHHQKPKATEPLGSGSGAGVMITDKTAVMNIGLDKMESKPINNAESQFNKSKKTVAVMSIDETSINNDQSNASPYMNVVVDSKANIIPAASKATQGAVQQNSLMVKDEIRTDNGNKLSNGPNVIPVLPPAETANISASSAPLKIVTTPSQHGDTNDKPSSKEPTNQSHTSEKVLNKLPPKIPEVLTATGPVGEDKPSTHKVNQETKATKAKISTATITTDSLKKSSAHTNSKIQAKSMPTGSGSVSGGKAATESFPVAQATENQNHITKVVDSNPIIGVELSKASHRMSNSDSPGAQKTGKAVVNDLPQVGAQVAKTQVLPTIVKVPQKTNEATTNKLNSTSKDIVAESPVLKNSNDNKKSVSQSINGKVDCFLKQTGAGTEASVTAKPGKTLNTAGTISTPINNSASSSKTLISVLASETSTKSEPNWNPEPVPQRRTKNIKKNLEVTPAPLSPSSVSPSPPSSSSNSTDSTSGAKQPTSIQSKDSSEKIINTVINSKVDLQPNHVQPTKSVKSPSPPSPIAEPVYQNNYPVQKSKSSSMTAAATTSVVASTSTSTATTEDVPPPIPEKKPQVKKEVNNGISSTNTTNVSSQKLIAGEKPSNSPHRFPSSLQPNLTSQPQQDQKNNVAKQEHEILQVKQSEVKKDLPVATASENKAIEESTASNIATQAVPEQAAGTSAASEKEDNVQTYLRMLRLMEQSDLISNAEELECPVCFSTVKANEGVVLRDCLHSFCRECLIGSVQYADEPEVKCPFRDDKYSCNSVVQEREIKALVPPELFERHLARSVKVAECKIVNTFHCKTADCTGWCVFEDDVNVFNCPVCKKRNCLTCQAIHEGVDCQQYQRQLAIDSETDENAKSSRLMLEKMIQRGEALECPACHVVLLKKWGCDWVRCSYCKTEICWITKGFRWGPNGKGDTSGGCKCGVNGVRCHPKCTYCH